MRVISSKGLVQKLTEAGLVPANCQRIIIDIPVGDAAYVYYRCLADERILAVDFRPGPEVISEDETIERPKS